MCFNNAALLTLVFASVAAGDVVAQPSIRNEARRPFSIPTPPGAMAQEKVWSAVVLASKLKDGQRVAVVAPELVPFVAKLSKFFGYDQFEVLGSTTKSMDGQTESWLVPTPNFWVGAKATREGEKFLLNLEFYHDKRLLLETVAVLGPKSPLFIRGPMHARGQLLVVFEVKP